ACVMVPWRGKLHAIRRAPAVVRHARCPYAGAPMSTDSDGPFTEAAIEALSAPAVRRLPPPTSLSPLPYDLNAGVPDRASLPAALLAKAARQALIDDPGAALTYGGQQGYEPLRAWIAARQAEETGLPVTSAWVTLTSGSAHG